jgi:hypothetical protein
VQYCVSVSIFYGEPTTWSADINQRITDWSKTSLGGFDVTFCSGALFFMIPTYLCGGVCVWGICLV